MFPRAAAGARNTQGEPGRGRGVKIGRWTSRVRGLPESFGELPVACLAEEIETPGDGQIRALITLAGNPARSTPNSGAARGGARVARLLRRVRPLPQRDDAPRRRHPAAAVAAPALALRPRLLPAVGAQHRELLAGRAPARARPAGRVAHAAAAGRRRRGPGAGRRRRRPRPHAWRSRSSRREVTDPEAFAGRARAAGRSRAPARRDAPRRSLRRSRSPTSRPPRTGSTSARSSRACPRSCARRAARSSWRRRRSSPTSSACAGALVAPRQRRDGARRPPPAALQQLVDAQPRPARARQGAVHAARPPRRRGAARPHRRRARAGERPHRRGRGAGRGDRRGDARRRLDAARVGPRRGRQRDDHRRRPRGHEHERALRRARARRR